MKTVTPTKFKETEIGLIPEEWGLVKSGDIFDIFTGKKDVNETVVDGEYIFFSCSLDEYKSNGYIFDGPAIIITGNGSYTGTVRFYEGKFDLYQRTYGVSLKKGKAEKWDIRFLYFYFKIYFEREFMGGSRGSSIPYIVRGNIENFLIPYLPINEQKQIAKILSSLDDKIELNRKINANLEKLAGSLFKKWFVDTGDELPEGWRIGKLFELIKIESGFPFSRDMFDESGKYKLVTIKNVQDGYFVSECTDSLRVIPDKIPAHCKLKDGDILLSLTGNVGRVCIVTGENYLLNQRVAVLNPIREQNRAFTYLLFRQKDFQNTLIGISRGTAQQNLSPIETKNLGIAIPPTEMLESFSRVANPIFEAMVDNIKQTSILTTLQDSLLPRLMNGKIRIKPYEN